MSLADALWLLLVWLLPVVGGLALGVWLRWTAVSLLLGFGFFVLSLMLFGYSLDHYSENGDCQAGAPCPTREYLLQFWPIAFLFGCSLVLGGSGRTVWNYLSQRRDWPRRHV